MASQKGLDPLYDFEVARTLADCLIDVADDIRDLATEMGVRPYRVFLVWVRWVRDQNANLVLDGDEYNLTEDEIGAGRPVLLREFELLPTPVVELPSVRKSQEATGLTESGSLVVRRISMRHSEDLLSGLLPEYRRPEFPDTLAPGIEFFWEIQENRPAGYVTPTFEGCERPTDERQPRRRFHLAGPPSRSVKTFDWSVPLNRADGERSRRGDVAKLVGSPEVGE